MNSEISMLLNSRLATAQSSSNKANEGLSELIASGSSKSPSRPFSHEKSSSQKPSSLGLESIEREEKCDDNLRVKISNSHPESVLITSLCKDIIKQLSSSLSQSKQSSSRRLSNTPKISISELRIFITMTSSWQPTLLCIQNVALVRQGQSLH